MTSGDGKSAAAAREDNWPGHDVILPDGHLHRAPSKGGPRARAGQYGREAGSHTGSMASPA